MCELVGARQGVGKDGVGARKELGRQADGDGLHLAQDRRSQGGEERRPGAPPLRREGTAVESSQKTTTVRPRRGDRNWKSPS